MRITETRKEHLDKKAKITVMRWLGFLALIFYGIHAGFHIWHGHPWDALWVCNLGTALVGIGFLLGSPIWLGIGSLWLIVGFPFWILDLVSGGEFLPTSLATHVGGLGLGLYGSWKLGVPRHIWWKAVLGLVMLQLVCGVITRSEANVNVAFRLYESVSSQFNSYVNYELFLLVFYSFLFMILEFAGRWFLGRFKSSAIASKLSARKK